MIRCRVGGRRSGHSRGAPQKSGLVPAVLITPTQMAKLIVGSQILGIQHGIRVLCKLLIQPFSSQSSWKSFLQEVLESLVADVFEASCGILIQDGIRGTLQQQQLVATRSKPSSIFKVEEKRAVRLALDVFADTLGNS